MNKTHIACPSDGSAREFSITPRIKTGQSGFTLDFNCSFIFLRVS